MGPTIFWRKILKSALLIAVLVPVTLHRSLAFSNGYGPDSGVIGGGNVSAGELSGNGDGVYPGGDPLEVDVGHVDSQTTATESIENIKRRKSFFGTHPALLDESVELRSAGMDAEGGASRSRGRGLASVGDVSKKKKKMVTALPQKRVERLISSRGVQEAAIIANEVGFFPKTVFVSRDVPVRLFVTSTSKTSLCFLLDPFAIRKQIKLNKVEEILFLPEEPGTYRFYCPINGSEGQIVVRDVRGAEKTASNQKGSRGPASVSEEVSDIQSSDDDQIVLKHSED